jgi:hypothetical protein
MRSALSASAPLLLAGMLCLAPASAGAVDLEVGRTLSCQSSGLNKQLYVTIGRVETHTDGRIVASVSLFNRAPKAELPVLAHVAIDAGVLAASCSTRTMTIALPPEFEDGYQQWLSAKGRVFTVSVDRIYDTAVDQVAKARQGGLSVQ